jgi:hypothetical protein
MSKPGRPPVLDKEKQDKLLGLIAIGCTRRFAAQSVGCAPSTVSYTAAHNPEFAQKLRTAQAHPILSHLKNINEAARLPHYWRASAWALERLRPDDYLQQKQNAFTPQQISQLMECLSQIIVEEIPIPDFRKNVLKRLLIFTQSLDAPNSPPNPDLTENLPSCPK